MTTNSCYCPVDCKNLSLRAHTRVCHGCSKTGQQGRGLPAQSLHLCVHLKCPLKGFGLNIVAPACNPSYSGGGGRMMERPAQGKLARLSQKQNTRTRVGAQLKYLSTCRACMRLWVQFPGPQKKRVNMCMVKHTSGATPGHTRHEC
jgi:hypothetical protein